MNKLDVVRWIADKTELPAADVERVVNTYHACITEALANDERVTLVGYGSYKVSHRAERIGRNPQTGKEMKISAAKVPTFKAGKGLKDAVNKKK